MPGAPGLLEILLVLGTIAALFIAPVIGVIAFWRICSKAGFPGALGLLMVVPIANVVLPLYLAFAEWPSLSTRGNG